VRRRLALVLAPLGLGMAGAALGSLALFAVAIGVLVVYAGCGAVVRAGARRLRVEREVGRREVVEGRPLPLRFVTGGLRGLPVHVEVRDATGAWSTLPAGGGAVDCTIARPGAHVVEPSRLRVRDDLGLFARDVRAGRPESVLVLPEPATTAVAARRGGADPVGDPEPDGLRTYVRGTSMSRIHWASAARGGELQERAFATAQDRLPLVVVDTAGTADGGALDWAARTAAGQVLSLVRTGGCRVLLPGDRTPTTVVDPAGQWPALHRRLAALEPGASPVVPGGDRGAVHVRAAAAPPESAARAPLPAGVRPLAGREAA
jgi:uncharacterized protein (DUF58 family)